MRSCNTTTSNGPFAIRTAAWIRNARIALPASGSRGRWLCPRAAASHQRIRCRTRAHGNDAARLCPGRWPPCLRHLKSLPRLEPADASSSRLRRSAAYRKVIKNLPEDDREVRRLHAEEILRVPLHQLDHRPTSLTGTLFGTGAIERFHPNRLDSTPLFLGDESISAAWCDAQAKVKTYLVTQPNALGKEPPSSPCRQ